MNLISGKILFLFGFLLLTISGCVVGPDYHKPDVDTPDKYAYKDSIKLQDSINYSIKDSFAIATADTAWWRLFNDPVLTELIQTGLRENADIKLASARVEQYLAYYGISRSAYYPDLNFNASSKSGKFSNAATNANDNPFKSIFNLSLTSDWEIDLWGKIKRTNESARADLLASEESRQSIVLFITSKIASSYIEILTLKRQLNLTKLTLMSRDTALVLYQLRYAKGDISLLDLAQFESDYWYVKSQIPFFEKLIAEAENNLNVLLGKNPGIVRTGFFSDSVIVPVIPEGLPSQLLQRRPDIRYAEQVLISANANIGRVKAEYYPAISLSGTLGVASSDLSNLFDPLSQVWNIGGNLFAPLFNAGRTKNKVRVAESQKKQALISYVNTVQSSFRDVENALADQTKTREQLGLLANRVDALQLYKDLATLNFNEGTSNYFEVLDAERSLFDSQIYYETTRGILLKSIVRIYSAFGGGWVTNASRQANQPVNMNEVDDINQNK